jgi:hypothetical protein
MFGPALQHERDYGLNLWERQTPDIGGLGVSIAGPDHQRALDWLGELDDYAQSVNQRVKMSGWLELFENRGGKVVYHGDTTYDLDGLTDFYDLVVAAGKGELVQLFDRDPSRSPYSSTQRILAVVYVHGMKPRPEHPTLQAVRFNAVPGIGELFIMPRFTVSGPCDILFFERIPGGPLDCWDDRPPPAQHLARTLDLMRQFVPWEYERCHQVELTDGRATLTGGSRPWCGDRSVRFPPEGTCWAWPMSWWLMTPSPGRARTAQANARPRTWPASWSAAISHLTGHGCNTRSTGIGPMLSTPPYGLTRCSHRLPSM